MTTPNAISGNQGQVVLARRWPEPVVLADGSVNRSASTILVRDPGYWPGDRVWVAAANGLPFSSEPPAPPAVLSNVFDCWIHRDELDEVSFYSSLPAALVGSPADRLTIDSDDVGRLVLAPFGAGSTYRDAAIEASEAVKDLRTLEADQENLLSELMPLPAAFTAPQAPGADDWMLVGDIEKWSFDMQGPGLPSKGLGEVGGDKTKDSIEAGGEITFLVRYSQQRRSYPALIALRLTLMLERSCRALARFYIVQDEASGHSFYQEAELMFERCSIDGTAAELIRISAGFSVIGVPKPRLSGMPTLCP